MGENVIQQSARLKRSKNRNEWLGLGVGYRVAEATRISHDDLKAKLDELNLATQLPKVPRDDDVFRRVATSHQRKHVPTSDAGVFENYLIRDVDRSAGKVLKQIVVEQVDPSNKRLAYEPAVQLEFVGGTGKAKDHIAVTTIARNVDPSQAENLAELILMDYANERGHLNGYAIREMIRRVLTDVSALPFLTGGVYFVQPQHTPTVEALEGLQIPGVEVHSFPIIDDTKQREMLRKSIEAETNEEMDRMLGDIEALLKGPEITADAFGKLTERRAAAVTKGKDYADMLEETLDNTGFRIQMVNAAMKKLFDHVKA